MSNILKKLISEFSISQSAVEKTIDLFKNGATVPFVARYRKEITEGMNDIQLRDFYDRWQYLEDFEHRQAFILNNLSEQKKLSSELHKAILESETKSQLEELYSPYKSSKVSKADIARQKGLAPLAELSWQQWDTFHPKNVQLWCSNNQLKISTEDAYSGVMDILCESLSLHIPLTAEIRKNLLDQGVIKSRVIRGKKEVGEKFQDYFDFSESNHPALKLYDEGEAKEGVGCGAALCYAAINAVNKKELTTKIESFLG